VFTPEILAALGQTVGIVIVVFAFLNHLKIRDKEITKAFDRNSKAFDENSTVMGKVLERLREG